ncbi:MAG: NifB/NifX family molybdenum-iron cluster-binding protein [Deltaproteobacteria bacterium]|nr:NifB/NifX family molybdenum-iron cluster-binding protein [Deltaproteobacteria bacterium]
MNKAAFAYWGNRIAPVFDIARQIRIVEVDSGHIARESQEVFSSSLPSHKAVRLAELGVGTLVCGAVSKPVLDLIKAYGIRVIPFIAGDVNDVIDAWLKGRINDNVFCMPGCGLRNRRRIGGASGIDRVRRPRNGNKLYVAGKRDGAERAKGRKS